MSFFVSQDWMWSRRLANPHNGHRQGWIRIQQFWKEQLENSHLWQWRLQSSTPDQECSSWGFWPLLLQSQQHPWHWHAGHHQTDHYQPHRTCKRVSIHSPYCMPIKCSSFQSNDMLQCCKTQGVKENCLGICSLQVDLDFLLYDEECFPDFEKFMTCGSDGSDHRHCCSQNGVPRECLDWCRGLPSKGPSGNCALSHAKTIKQCFNDGQFTLPGPPR